MIQLPVSSAGFGVVRFGHDVPNDGVPLTALDKAAQSWGFAAYIPGNKK